MALFIIAALGIDLMKKSQLFFVSV